MNDEKPLNRVNGTNFRDSILKVDGNLAVFRKNWRSKSSLFLFGFGCGLFFFFIAFMSIITTPNLVELWGEGLAVYIFLLTIFILLLIFLYRVASKVHCFDLAQQLYYCGKEPDDKAIHLNNVTSVQVIRKPIYNNSHKYDSFELNIVTKSGKRIKVSDHSEGDWIKIEAKQLADFLKIELNLINTNA
ncbi:hypothetical protein H5181_20170 [Shewanella sp. SG44-2]|uniref:hypothetical protein n=1 Tax=Shewanella sp. SG44-2 TaxID=2760962 RepID=UPI001600042D|nr:hypothetical protein [Shewanella sp. SG44-2]MBB1428746.1 hypothetical protein [Shewanella sp. SG44-2]